ncbi:MAG: tetratricopeptide repeat protein [Verrucomicrobia bacterium]|nr:tetratricopeptide repeat protein [Verrucomicrobiota bacterium]
MRAFIAIFALALMLITVGLYRVVNHDWVSWRQAEDADKKGDYRQAMENYSILWSKGFEPALVFPSLFAAYLRSGQPDKAAQVAREAILIAQSSPGRSRLKSDAEDSNSIAEWKARLELARALSYAKQYSESVTEYRRVLKMRPDLPQAQLELARVLFWAGNVNAALLEFLRVPVSVRQRDLPALELAAKIYAARGDFAEAESYFQHASNKSGGKNYPLIREWAAARLTSGDYYGAEELIRAMLAGKVSTDEDLLRLADILKAEQRYEEAEGIYWRRLVVEAPTAPFFLGMADLKYREKKYREALQWLRDYKERFDASPAFYLLTIHGLVAQGYYDEAWDMCDEFREIAPTQADPWLEMGKLALKQNRPDLSKVFFSTAHSCDSNRVEALYFSKYDVVTNMTFVASLTNDANNSPIILCKWGDCYAGEGHSAMAIACYRAAFNRDPACLPAAIGEAFMFGVDHQYDSAINKYSRLAKAWPRHRMIQLDYARVLSWSKNYDRAIEQYDRLIGMAVEDPLPVFEKARVAFWKKSFHQSMDYYQELCAPPVDWQLTVALQNILRTGPQEKNTAREWLSKKVERLRSREGKDIYKEMESFLNEWPLVSPTWSKAWRQPVENTLVDLWPAYLIQKNAVLERTAKANLWQRRWQNAEINLKELTATTPGNEEAWFDLAQSQYALGLKKSACQTYAQLLALDPLHQMAPEGLRKLRIDSHPALDASYDYWYENGYGHLAQITRHETAIRADVPIASDYYFTVAGEQWQYRPNEVNQTWLAYGPTLQAGGVANHWLKGNFAYSRQIFESKDVQNANSGYAEIEGALNDYFSLGLRGERQNNFANVYALKQGIQLDSIGAHPVLRVNRDIQVDGEAAWQAYTDQNSAQHHWLRGMGLLTQHPRELKLILRGDYRNTSEKDQEIWENGQLVDIVHPYWSPQDYFAGAAGLEWRHDLAKNYFAGAKLNYYDLICTFSTDTEDNPGVALGGEWRYDLTPHVAFRVTGMINRSRKWDAEQLSLRLTGCF